jgi:hypothetical protein
MVDRIRATSDMKARVQIAGLLRKPFTGGDAKQQCATCIYFLHNLAFCDLPELNFPVDADWWCRLWRV